MTMNAGQNTPGQLLPTTNMPLGSHLPYGADGPQIIAETNRGTKEWHQSATQALRNHLVYRVVHAIYPTPRPADLKDRRMNNLVAYARKVEADMYNTANSREEYFFFLAEKIYKIQKELEEKRLQRREHLRDANKPLCDAAGMGGIRPPFSLGNDLLGGRSTISTKEWHLCVTRDLRNHIVYKLVQAIFPTPNPAAVKDRRMNNLVAYARKVEADMYHTANSWEEYHHFLAEKIYKLKKKLEEKRRLKRRERPRVAAGMGGIRPPSSLGNNLLGGWSTLNQPPVNPEEDADPQSAVNAGGTRNEDPEMNEE